MLFEHSIKSAPNERETTMTTIIILLSILIIMMYLALGLLTFITTFLVDTHPSVKTSEDITSYYFVKEGMWTAIFFWPLILIDNAIGLKK